MTDEGEKHEPISIKYQPPILPLPPGGNDLRLIKNPFPHFEGYITDKLTVCPIYSEECECIVYHYIVPDSSPPNPAWTYVVVQFEQSTRYIYVKPTGELAMRKAKYWKTGAKDITSTADTRVFLMRQPVVGGIRGVIMFASSVASQQQPNNPSKARVITVVWEQNQKRVELRPDREGKIGLPLEAQLFEVLEYQHSDQPWDESRPLEWVRAQHPLKPPEGVDEESSAVTSVGQSPKKSKSKFFSK